MTIACTAYVGTTGIVLIVALYLSVANHGCWPAFRALRVRHAVMAVLLAWAMALQWPGFVSALTVANRWDQPASTRARLDAPNPGSREHGPCASHPGEKAARPDPLRPCTAAASVAPHAALTSALRAYSPARSQPDPYGPQGAARFPSHRAAGAPTEQPK